MTDQPAPAIPRPAATMLLVRGDPMEVLMVRRHARATFASALVFPGGTVDPDDASERWLALCDGADGLDATERGLRIAALRETFEETAILVAEGITAPCGDPATTPFHDAVSASGGRLRLDRVVPIGHWITPAIAPKRFDTHFYLASAPEGAEAVCDGGETVALEWATPQAILARAAAGERSILFPTRMNLKRLAESPDIAAAMAAARARPPFTVEPTLVKRDGRTTVTIPIEAGYGITDDIFVLG